MAMKSLRKIKTKLQFLYRKNEFLNPKLRRLLCDSLMQPQFDYACVSWYALVRKKMRKTIQVTQINISYRSIIKELKNFKK